MKVVSFILKYQMMLTKFVYNRDLIEDNIMEMWDGLSITSILTNKNWYRDTHMWCKTLAESKGLDVLTITGIFAALSPQCSFKQNKLYCEQYLIGINKHTKGQTGKCDRIMLIEGTYTERHKQVLIELGGRKTQAFFDNILHYKTSQRVTLDRHAFRVAGFDITAITEKQYDFLEEVYQTCAKKVNMLPCELQGITWQHWRDSNNKSKFFD